MPTEIKLGLCNPPSTIYLYVNQGEVNGEFYVWYKYDISQEKKIPVQHRALTGYLSELRLTTKEYREKDNMKLDIVVSADQLYVIRTGLETNFAKTFLLAASQVTGFSKPLIIAVTAGEKNTVFCRLYDATSKTRISREWDKNADWAGIIQDIQCKLTCTLDEDFAPAAPEQNSQPQPTLDSQDLRVESIRTLLSYPYDLVKEWLQSQDVERPSQLTKHKIDELVKTMCLAWAADKGDHSDDVISSYHSYVLSAITIGVDEITALSTWMQEVEARASLLPVPASLS